MAREQAVIFFSAKRVLGTLLALGVLFFLFGGTRRITVQYVDQQIPIAAAPQPAAVPLVQQPPPAPPAPVAPIETKAVKDKDEFSVASQGFWKGLGSTKGHVFDPKLAAAVISYFKTEGASTILELGAGMGLYAKEMKAQGFFVNCYDGNPDTQALSEGRCGIVDLSQSMDFHKHDWVLSLEVGEHIPAQFEEIFLANLDRGNTRGMILSWAVEGQGGTSHVNNRNNSYIREKLAAMGYNSDFEAEKMLRAEATMGWFKNTIMVFKKRPDLIK